MELSVIEETYLIPVQKIHMFALNRMIFYFIFIYLFILVVGMMAYGHLNCMWIHLETVNVVYYGMMILTVIFGMSSLLTQWPGCFNGTGACILFGFSIPRITQDIAGTAYWQWRHLSMAQLADP